MTKEMTIKQATERMVDTEINAIPQVLIEKAYFENDNFESFRNITPLYDGQQVIYDNEEYTVFNSDYEGNAILTHDGVQMIEVNPFEIDEIENRPFLPMWSTMWQTTSFLTYWIENNMELVASLGFQIYECDDLDGLILGIDGAGYDFYEMHWIPLYNAQGLKWHNKE
ncbi:hypothetical protein [Mammaliicoccus sp. P-M59]|uniref:hypothetical protein n=1 Tax=Mammaliicoccus sp. P-M59 TaxID=2898718 RepID=UPI001EFACC19|nr:hypothetical protein [Mammaliicoccus sp. P-M59]